MATKVNLAEKFGLFSDQWSPKMVARFNQNEVRLCKLEGEFHWHHHSDTDELFLVIEGELELDFEDGTAVLGPGEMIVVPAGVEHRPRAANGEAKVFVMDAEGTPNTGDAATSAHVTEI
jgi:mannose-6-phosphate isomerase-like protein (cupin superfamily)